MTKLRLTITLAHIHQGHEYSYIIRNMQYNNKKLMLYIFIHTISNGITNMLTKCTFRSYTTLVSDMPSSLRRVEFCLLPQL